MKTIKSQYNVIINLNHWRKTFWLPAFKYFKLPCQNHLSSPNCDAFTCELFPHEGRFYVHISLALRKFGVLSSWGSHGFFSWGASWRCLHKYLSLLQAPWWSDTWGSRDSTSLVFWGNSVRSYALEGVVASRWALYTKQQGNLWPHSICCQD